MDSVVIQALQVRGRSFLFGCQGRTDTSTRILGAIYTVPKPIRHNPGVSLPLIISDHGFCGHPWLSMYHGSEGGPFSSAAREGLIIIDLVALILSGGAVAMFHQV